VRLRCRCPREKRQDGTSNDCLINIHGHLPPRGAVGLTQANILQQLSPFTSGSASFDNKIAYTIELFNEEVHLVVRPKIMSIKQPCALTVNLGARRTGTSYSMRDFSKALEIEVKEVSKPPG